MCAVFKGGTGNGHHLIDETLQALLAEGKWRFVHKDEPLRVAVFRSGADSLAVVEPVEGELEAKAIHREFEPPTGYTLQRGRQSAH